MKKIFKNSLFFLLPFLLLLVLIVVISKNVLRNGTFVGGKEGGNGPFQSHQSGEETANGENNDEGHQNEQLSHRKKKKEQINLQTNDTNKIYDYKMQKGFISLSFTHTITNKKKQMHNFLVSSFLIQTTSICIITTPALQ